MMLAQDHFPNAIADDTVTLSDDHSASRGQEPSGPVAPSDKVSASQLGLTLSAKNVA